MFPGQQASQSMIDGDIELHFARMANPTLNHSPGYSDTDNIAPRQSDPIETNNPEKHLSLSFPTNAASSELATSSKRNDSSARWEASREVKWDNPSDPSFPRNFPIWRKWAIVSINSSTALCVTCTSSLYTSTYEQLKKQFDCSQIVATLGLSLFIFGLGLGPLVWGPLSEVYGR